MTDEAELTLDNEDGTKVTISRTNETFVMELESGQRSICVGVDPENIHSLKRWLAKEVSP